MELQGKVIAALPARSGTSARGEWKAQDFVIETHDAYPRKLVFSVFGEDRLSRFNIQVGQEVTVAFDIDAHEYNGRWFNSVRAYDVRLANVAPAQGMASAPVADPFGAAPTYGSAPQQTVQNAAPQQVAPVPEMPGESADDLPF